MLTLRTYLESKPIVAGLFATVTGWTGAALNWLDGANKVFTTLGALFGSVAAFFTMLLVIRKWLRKQ